MTQASIKVESMLDKQTLLQLLRDNGMPDAVRVPSGWALVANAAYTMGLRRAREVCLKVARDSGGEHYNMFGKDLAEQCAERVESMLELAGKSPQCPSSGRS